MKELKLKVYLIPKQLKEIWKKNTVAYTIECYTSSRAWNDGIITQSMHIGMNHEEYKDLMKEKFNCIEFDYKLFFQTKSQCEEAIEFIDSLIILRKLL